MRSIRKYDWKLSWPNRIFQSQSSDGPNRVQCTGRTGHCLVQDSRKEQDMREWLKPTIEETESGMEVTSYLPAELDRA